MKTTKQLFLLLLLSVSCFLTAQENNRRPNVSEMHERKFEFLIDKAQLSKKEAEALKPKFMEYEKALWELHQQHHKFFKEAMKKTSEENPNYAELNDRYIDSELKQSILLKKYHLQIRKLVSPETLFKYYQAEREFKRHLMDDMRGKSPRKRQPD